MIAIFYMQALGVLILYARCTAIDPADPGILIEPDRTARSQCEASLPGQCKAHLLMFKSRNISRI